ncbi:MAG: TolC family protein [Candidatus Binatia bacterium]|nr:TolC family protein [Candidatus Binatia bacterium]
MFAEGPRKFIASDLQIRDPWFAVCALLAATLLGPGARIAEAQDADPGGAGLVADLTTALGRTYENNPGLAASRADQRAVDEEIPQAKADWFRPTISGKADGNYTLYRQSQGASSRGREAAPVREDIFEPSLSGNLSFPIFRGGSTLNGLRAAEASVAAGSNNLAGTEQSLLGATATGYANVAYYQTLVGINREEIKKGYAPLAKMLETMVRSRTSTVTDLAQVHVQLASARADLESNIAELATATETFERLVGAPPGELDPKVQFSIGATGLDAAIEIGLAENPGLLAARADVESSRFEVAKLKGALLPDLSLQALVDQEWEKLRYVDDENKRISDSDRTSTFGAVASIPIYEGGARYSEIRQQRQELAAAQANLQYVQRETRVGVRSGWQQYRAYQRELAAYDKAIQAGRVAVEGKLKEFRNGTTSTQEVLISRENLFDAMEAQAYAQLQQTTSLVQLLTAMGRFDAKSLELPVTLYDPGKYLDEVRDRWIGYEID